MISHVAGLFTHPAQEWKAISETEESISHMYFSHVLFIAMVPPIAAYIGTTKIGWTVTQSGSVVLTESSALILSALMYLTMLAGVAVMGVFIKWMSLTYHSSPALARCIVFAAYTATPLFIAGLVLLYPTPLLVMLVGVAAIFYTVYLLYSGIATFMHITEEEGFMFASSVLTVGMVMLVALMAISVVIWSLGFGPIFI